MFDRFSDNVCYRCVLLVAPDVSVLEASVQKLATEACWPVVSVGETIALHLLDVSPARWSRAARQHLREILLSTSSEHAVLLRVDLLFDPALGLDPLALFREMSRGVQLVVAWPGSYDGSTLSYAAPEHDHYQTWRDPQVAVYRLQLT